MLTNLVSRHCLVIAILYTVAGSALAEEGTVEAFSSWEARGQFYPTGPTEATFVGALYGVLYVEGGDGSTDAGLITCPGTVTINTEDSSQVGRGKCVVVTPDGDRIFGHFVCEGAYLEGCNGDFKLTGGTGSNEGISGGGPVKLKMALAQLTSLPGSMVEQSAVGLAVWPELTYKLP